MSAPLPDAEFEARIRLARCDGIGPMSFRRLVERFGSARGAIEALPALARQAGRPTPLHPPTVEAVRRERDRLAALGGRFVLLGEPAYPPLLAALEDAPPLLAVLGEVGLLAQRAVAVVGGRNATANGQRIAESLGADLARAGLVIVSGLARGVDAAAHRGALATGRTVAAIAGGLDCPYPPENAALQAEIAASGAVVAEAPLGTAPLARHFPRRNRVIAGLALGVVVVEAALRSGSLITARLAAENGRELFAVPGSPLDPRCQGSNDLIRQGGHLTESAADVLANLPDHPSRQGLARVPGFAAGPAPGFAEPRPAWEEPAESGPALAAARESVLELLGPSPTAVDEILRRCPASAAAVASILLDLELAGSIETLPGNRVALLATPGESRRNGMP